MGRKPFDPGAAKFKVKEFRELKFKDFRTESSRVKEISKTERHCFTEFRECLD